jgi:hypothetical protein
MAGVTFIKRSSVPVAVKGKAATDPTISISEKGQIVLNSLATKWLGSNLVGLGFSEGKVFLFKETAKALAKMPKEELIAFRKATKGEYLGISGSYILKNSFGDWVYDFAASGNQTFKLTEDTKNDALTFDLPKGAIAARPKAARKPRKTAVKSVKAEVGSTVAQPATVESVKEEELVLA